MKRRRSVADIGSSLNGEVCFRFNILFWRNSYIVAVLEELKILVLIWFQDTEI